MAERQLPDASALTAATPQELIALINEHRMNWSTKRESNPAGGFARALMMLGHNGLRAVEEKTHTSGQSTDRRSVIQMYKYLSTAHPEQTESFALNHVAVVLGAALVGLEEATIEGELNMRTVAEAYNLHVNNTGLTRWELDQANARVPLTPEVSQSLREKAEADPSFVFALNTDFMPEQLINFIKGTVQVRNGIAQMDMLLSMAPKAVRTILQESSRTDRTTEFNAAIQFADRILAQDDPLPSQQTDTNQGSVSRPRTPALELADQILRRLS